MFGKWRKAKKASKQSQSAKGKPEPKSSGKKSGGITVTVKIPRLKRCPACGSEYDDYNLVVCPKDRTMLLSPYQPCNWYDWSECAKYCPQCKATYYDYRPVQCSRDGVELVPLTENPFGAPVLQERYKLVKFIERGEFFEEYEARDLENDKAVRVKMMKRDLSLDSRTVTNFFKYVRPAIGLKHDMLITAIGVNATEEGVPYLITDYVNTRTLDQELEARVLTLSDTRKLFRDFLDGIQHAHDNDIVHGGISRHNLFIERDSEPLKGYVGNFGIAERLFRELDWSAASTSTHTANVYGDPSTICPEFCTGQRPTPATDIYQIGCCLYQCLSGKIPFERPTMPMILLAHMTDPPDDIRKKNPEITRELAAIVYRCLSKDPAERFPSARALSEALASEVVG